MARINNRFADLLTGGIGRVEKAGRGHFRARYAGFTQSDAKQACNTLSAKGEHCLVIAGS